MCSVGNARVVCDRGNGGIKYGHLEIVGMRWCGVKLGRGTW